MTLEMHSFLKKRAAERLSKQDGKEGHTHPKVLERQAGRIRRRQKRRRSPATRGSGRGA